MCSSLSFSAVRTVTVDVLAPDPEWTDVDTTNVPEREARYGHASAAEIRMAREAGATAYHTPRAMAAPWLHATVQDLVGRDPLNAVGRPRTAQIFKAFSAGWDEQRDAACDAILRGE